MSGAVWMEAWTPIICKSYLVSMLIDLIKCSFYIPAVVISCFNLLISTFMPDANLVESISRGDLPVAPSLEEVCISLFMLRVNFASILHSNLLSLPFLYRVGSLLLPRESKCLSMLVKIPRIF